VEKLTNERRQQMKIFFVFILCALTGSGGVFLLVRDISQDSKGSRGVLMAKLEKKEAKVRRKFSTSFSWGNVKEEEPLYKKDSVLTGPESTATIRMNEGETIEIGENSLVVIDLVDQLTMNPMRGSFVVRTKDGDKKVDVGADGKTRVQALPMHLQSPAPYSVRFLSGQSKIAEIKFIWETKLPQNVKKEVPLQIEIAHDRKFKSIVTTQPVQDVTLLKSQVTLPPGQYHWRITQEGKPLAESISFRVASASALLPIEPSTGSSVSVFEQDPMMKFRWNGPEAGEAREDLDREDVSHVLEVSSVEDFSHILKSESIRGTTGFTHLTGIPFGELFWRIKSRYGAKSSGDQLEVISRVSKFTVERAKALVVTLTQPENNTTHDFASQFHFVWQCDSPLNDVAYQFTLKSKEGKVVAEDNLISNAFVWKKPEPGMYSWQVKALFKGKVLGESPQRIFSVYAGAPLALVSPDKNASAYSWKKQTPVKFEWKTDELIGKQNANYEIEFSKDATFKTVEARLQNLKKNSVISDELTLESGSHFWRVRVVDVSGTLIKVSEVRHIELGLFPRLNGPSAIQPQAGFSKNLLEDDQDLTLKWNEVKDAHSYELVLIENKSGVNRVLASLSDEKLPGRVVLFRKIEDTSVSIPFKELKVIPPGKYEWAVRAIDPVNRGGEWMFPREMTISAGELLSAPSILSPEVQ